MEFERIPANKALENHARHKGKSTGGRSGLYVDLGEGTKTAAVGAVESIQYTKDAY